MLLLHLRLFNETKTKSNIVAYKYMYVMSISSFADWRSVDLVLLQLTGMHLLLE